MCQISVAEIVSLLELIHASAGVDDLLFARKERMTLTANIDSERIAFFSSSRLKGFSASAGHRHLMIIGMYLVFHSLELPPVLYLLEPSFFTIY